MFEYVHYLLRPSNYTRISNKTENQSSHTFFVINERKIFDDNDTWLTLLGRCKKMTMTYANDNDNDNDNDICKQHHRQDIFINW